MNVIVDIDGTIADCRHRRHFIHDPERKQFVHDTKKKDWPAFFEAMKDDAVIEPVVILVKKLMECEHIEIRLVTGRPSNYRSLTEKWLQDNDIYYHELYMRNEGDFRQDYIVKEEILNGFKLRSWIPDLAIDDKQEVVDMWRRNGIICLQNSMKELP